MVQAQALPTIRTPRLTLRALRPDDRVAIADGIGNYDVSRWLSVVPYPYDLAEADKYLAATIAENKQSWAICDAGGLIGGCGIDNGYGYWLARSAWNQGYATEAGDAVLDHVFRELGAAVLDTRVFDGNDKSRRVLDKLGFLPTGRTRIKARALSQSVDATTLQISRDRWLERRRFRVSGARVDIREISPDDWQDMQRLAGVEAVARMLLRIPVPWPERDVKNWIASALFRGRPGFRGVISTKSGDVIGGVGLGRAVGAGPMTCMYWLGTDHWGRGYATEAMRAFLTEAYDIFPDLDMIEADHFTDNPASGRVMQKLGFERIGEGVGTSRARLEPDPVILYRVSRQSFRAQP